MNINKATFINYPINLKDPYTVAFQPGDFILVRDHQDTIDHIVAFGQSMRFHGKYSKYNEFVHAAIIVNNEGDIVEALGKGVSGGNLAKYCGIPHTLVRISASIADRQEMVEFARACVGEKYGWTTIVSIGISLLTGLKFSFGFDGQEICSGLVARALERTTAIFPEDASHITPAMLGKYYEVLE